MTGALFLSVAFTPATYKPSRELLSKLQAFEFTRKIVQYHCETCGTMMIESKADDPDVAEPKVEWGVVTGTIEIWDGVLALNSHDFVHDTTDGGFTHFLPHLNGKESKLWSGQPETSEKLSPYWSDKETTSKDQPQPTSRLHAYCKCKGVRFYIARPSSQSTQAYSDWPNLIVPFRTGSSKNPDNEAWWLRANGTKFLAGTCTCNSCRLASGVEVVQWAFIPTIDISLDAEGKIPYKRSFGTLKTYRSSQGVDRHFCSCCGAMVFYSADDRPDLLDVAVGLLDAPEGARAETWLEWEPGRVSYREDAMDRAGSFVTSLEEGLKAFKQAM
jgi:hypothetical protein